MPVSGRDVNPFSLKTFQSLRYVSSWQALLLLQMTAALAASFLGEHFEPFSHAATFLRTHANTEQRYQPEGRSPQFPQPRNPSFSIIYLKPKEWNWRTLQDEDEFERMQIG